MYTAVPNVAVELSAPLVRIPNVTGSNVLGLTVLMEVFRGFPRFLRGNARIVLYVNPLRLNFFTILYKNSVLISQETQYVSATKPNRLMLFRETVAVYCEIHTEHTNALCWKNSQFCYVKERGIRCADHAAPSIRKSWH
jgi:hypothetical protein